MIFSRFPYQAAAFMLSLCTLLLAGCGNIANFGSLMTQYSTPPSSEIARLRVITDGIVRGVPASSCIDWRREGAGVIAVVHSGFTSLRNQSLGIPASRRFALISPEEVVRSEVLIPANKPFALNYQEQEMVSGASSQCAGSMTFSPGAGQDYELVLVGGTCMVRLERLGDGRDITSSLQKTGLCNALDAF